MSLIRVRGVHYHVKVQGKGPTVLFLHGFTGTASTWTAVQKGLPDRYRVVSVDLLGHGKSSAPDDPKRYALTECVQDLTELVDELGLGRVHLVGYSMGGRLALHMALARQHLLVSLVLVSASPGIADATTREARLQSDAQLARLILDKGVRSFVDYWESIPLFATEKQLPPDQREALRRERLSQRPQGLAGSLLGAGAGQQEYLMDALRTIGVPTLIVAGALDEKYVAFAHDMQRAMPNARKCIVPGTGHAVHRERPDVLAKLLSDHLQDLEGLRE